MKKGKSLTQLLAELDACNKKIEEIKKPDSAYIKERVQEIFGDKDYAGQFKKDVETILNEALPTLS